MQAVFTEPETLAARMATNQLDCLMDLSKQAIKTSVCSYFSANFISVSILRSVNNKKC